MKKFVYILSAWLFSLPGLLSTHCAKGQTAAADNKVSESITFHEMPKGLAVYGIFEGRSPCCEISRELGSDLPPDYDHLKWQIVFFRDTVTRKPTTFTLTTEMFGSRPLRGKWRIFYGSKADPGAIVYALDYGQSGKSIYLLKGDENVLFILDENLEFRTGNQNFSYTLNRVQKVLRLPD